MSISYTIKSSASADAVVAGLRLPVAALIYAGAFHYAYVVFLNPVYEYAYFLYFPPTIENLLFTYTLGIAPVIFYRPSLAPAAYGAALIYGLCYVPAQFLLLFMWERSIEEQVIVQSSIAISMAILLRASALGQRAAPMVQPSGFISGMVGLMTVASISLLILSYHQHMRFVSFGQVYELRSEASSADKGFLVNYLVMWLGYCFVPFYFARGIVRRSFLSFCIGLLGSVLIYLAMGAKIAILTGVIIYSVNFLFGSGNKFLFRLLLALAVVVMLVVTLLPDDGPLLWVKSIFLLRVLGTGGWAMTVYYDYFSNNGFTYYSHIGLVNALTDAYSYGEYSLGQLIGIHYSGSAQANFNANFWASDAFAAMGLAGVPVVTAALCVVFLAINHISSGYPLRFIVLWFTGFWVVLLNVPLSTSLLSGGGMLMMLLLWVNSKMPRIRFFKGAFV